MQSKDLMEERAGEIRKVNDHHKQMCDYVEMIYTGKSVAQEFEEEIKNNPMLAAGERAMDRVYWNRVAAESSP